VALVTVASYFCYATESFKVRGASSFSLYLTTAIFHRILSLGDRLISMTYTRVETTKTQSGAFTISRNFSLRPLHSKVKLSKYQIQNIPHIHSFLHATPSRISATSISHNQLCFHHSFQISPNTSLKASPDTRQIHSHASFAPDIPFFFNVQLEDHSLNLSSVNVITSASEMCTKYIEIKLFNNLKC